MDRYNPIDKPENLIKLNRTKSMKRRYRRKILKTRLKTARSMQESTQSVDPLVDDNFNPEPENIVLMQSPSMDRTDTGPTELTGSGDEVPEFSSPDHPPNQSDTSTCQCPANIKKDITSFITSELAKITVEEKLEVKAVERILRLFRDVGYNVPQTKDALIMDAFISTLKSRP